MRRYPPFNYGIIVVLILNFLFWYGVISIAKADDFDTSAPFNGREFNDPKTHKRTLQQEQLELLRLQIEARQPFTLPGVPGVARCDVRNIEGRYNPKQ